MTLQSYNSTCKRDHSLSRDAWTELFILLRTYTCHDADLSECPSTKWSERYDISPASELWRSGSAPKVTSPMAPNDSKTLRSVQRPGAARNVSRWARMPYPRQSSRATRWSTHKASGGSGSYPVVRQWVDGLHAPTLYANGDLKPDNIPIATFSNGTEVLAHSNANRKVNAHISWVIPMTLPPGASSPWKPLYLPFCVPHAKAFENDEGVIVLVLDHPEWAGLVDTATTFQTPGGQEVRLDDERNYNYYRRVVEAMERHPTKLESLRRRGTGISVELECLRR
ncbi:hypothetical protein MVLG_00204 [Microbotryum lychnidis-dioicae p1A1 Lamole]|uniref:Uncharacterized protein n=1 Tax=Microbotryum lychnidis-dioicae (strain p1A1 Lamole / MvSl-1064) TaxID=683840 RepID=U5GYD6_USTV1|nr:hypothetical protein MVLG_00204 [Microbotryum lychnidis-dioicae p1A1 Lamole]|eukprot:KDE09805.1 hypothetical protein MVLG_00204 [Microbotryum lychnidis-dioicae p1A1 Lamole]